MSSRGDIVISSAKGFARIRVPVVLGGVEHMLTRSEWKLLVTRTERAWQDARRARMKTFQIEADLLAHPDSTVREIAERIGYRCDYVACWISRWIRWGFVRPKKKFGESMRVRVVHSVEHNIKVARNNGGPRKRP